MWTPNTNQSFRSNDPVWYLLAEFSLSELFSDPDRSGGLSAGFLFQAVNELNLSPECRKNIINTLTVFAKEALVHFKPGRFGLPGRIRVFCQNKIIDDANSAKTSRPYLTEQAIDPIQMIDHSAAKMIGGWGYFLIERGGNVPADPSERSWNSVDLYLYREGE